MRGKGGTSSAAGGVNKPVRPPRGVATIAGKQVDKVRSAGELARACSTVVTP